MENPPLSQGNLKELALNEDNFIQKSRKINELLGIQNKYDAHYGRYASLKTNSEKDLQSTTQADISQKPLIDYSLNYYVQTYLTAVEETVEKFKTHRPENKVLQKLNRSFDAFAPPSPPLLAKNSY